MNDVYRYIDHTYHLYDDGCCGGEGQYFLSAKAYRVVHEKFVGNITLLFSQAHGDSES